MRNDHLTQLERFAETRSEPAFHALVEEHLTLVFATARRQLNGDGALAEDVAQQVFIDLARKAATLPSDVVLGGWLYRHTLFLSRKAVRTESRRRRREGIAADYANIEAERGVEHEPWRKFSPMVDQALAKLRPVERQAIVLRFLEGRPLKAVGESLGVSEDTARKRVSRAMDKLRSWLKKRGVPISVSGLALALGSESAKGAVPVNLASSIAAHAVREVPQTTASFLSGVALPNLVAATLGVIVTFIAGATIARPDSSSVATAPPPRGEVGLRSAIVVSSDLRRNNAGENLALGTIVERIREIAGRPATTRSRAELAKLIKKIAPEDLPAAATAFNSFDNSRRVWFEVMSPLFDRWTKHDTAAALEFYASALRDGFERNPFTKLLRAWEADPDQLVAARAWFVGVAGGEGAQKIRDGSGLLTDIAAEIALKQPATFESFLKSIPPVPAKGSDGYLLPDTVRRTTIGRIYKISVEKQRPWAEALEDPKESAVVILTMLSQVVRNNGGDISTDELFELGDWALDSLPAESRNASSVYVLTTLSERDAEAAIDWYRTRSDAEPIDQMAQQVLSNMRGSSQPRVQLAWVDQLSDPSMREDLAAGIFRRWCRAPEVWYGARGPVRVKQTATEYLETTELDPARRARFTAILAKP